MSATLCFSLALQVMHRSKLIRIETVLYEIRLLPSRYLAKTSYLFRKTVTCQRVFLPDNPRDQEPSNRLLSRHKGKERVCGEKGGTTSFSGLFPYDNGKGGKRPWHRPVTWRKKHPEIVGVRNKLDCFRFRAKHTNRTSGKNLSWRRLLTGPHFEY